MTKWDPNEKGEYWVIGGRYTDMTFKHRRWSEVLGPFASRYEAEACWRKISFAYSHHAEVRFTITQGVGVSAAA
jgi:hypothetical protein